MPAHIRKQHGTRLAPLCCYSRDKCVVLAIVNKKISICGGVAQIARLHNVDSAVRSVSFTVCVHNPFHCRLSGERKLQFATEV